MRFLRKREGITRGDIVRNEAVARQLNINKYINK